VRRIPWRDHKDGFAAWCDGATGYAWDAENRLIGVEPLLVPMEGVQKVSFGYDVMGRRFRKAVYTYNGTSETWVQTGDTKVVWAGWLLLLELDGTDSDAVLRKYTWGLDVAGQNGQLNSLASAGGIGGLLGVYDTNGTTTGQNPTEDDKTYVYLYDANGNVGQLVAWVDGYEGATGSQWHADRMVATYEYTPYGTLRASAGDYADDNPFRFSTKQWDDETGLGYWGYRYYSPTLGRWVSRDPIGERGAALVREVAAQRAFTARNVSSRTLRHRRQHLAFPESERDTEPHTYRAVRNAPLAWMDPDGACPIPCDPQYPPPDPPAGARYDCVGLACRTWTCGETATEMLEGFRVGGNCDLKCRPCEIKCWLWTFDEAIRQPDGSYYRWRDTEATTRQNEHIVCGQVGPGGEAPRCFDKFGWWGELRGPGDCASYKPAEREEVMDSPGYYWIRSNYVCHSFCGPTSAVPGLAD